MHSVLKETLYALHANLSLPGIPLADKDALRKLASGFFKFLVHGPVLFSDVLQLLMV